jgi:hypothetical protein
MGKIQFEPKMGKVIKGMYFFFGSETARRAVHHDVGACTNVFVRKWPCLSVAAHDRSMQRCCTDPEPSELEM